MIKMTMHILIVEKRSNAQEGNVGLYIKIFWQFLQMVCLMIYIQTFFFSFVNLVGKNYSSLEEFNIHAK